MIRVAQAPVDLMGWSGSGPLWAMASADLNATLLSWPAGDGVPEHVNDELDVLIVVLDGSGTAIVDGERHALAERCALLVEQGASRSITAGDGGLRYLSIHRRRGPLQIQPLVRG